MDDDLRELISIALQPRRNEIVQAKKLALDNLRDKERVGIRALVWALSDSEGLTDPQAGAFLPGLLDLESHDYDGIRRAVDASAAIDQRRLIISSMHAVAEMAAAGLIFPKAHLLAYRCTGWTKC